MLPRPLLTGCVWNVNVELLRHAAVQTHTIVQLLLLVTRQQDAGYRPAGPILVAAQTNTAVDNILRKLNATMHGGGTGIPSPDTNKQ